MQIGRWNFSDSVVMLSLVRRQSFWDREWLKLREFLAPLVNDVNRHQPFLSRIRPAATIDHCRRNAPWPWTLRCPHHPGLQSDAPPLHAPRAGRSESQRSRAYRQAAVLTVGPLLRALYGLRGG
jgi:hypothetical protein